MAQKQTPNGRVTITILKKKGVKNGWQKMSSMTPKKTLLRCTSPA
jgi:hypothetical protein